MRAVTSVLLAMMPIAAQAGPATDAVADIYAIVGQEPDPAHRDRFAGAARAFLDANDRVWDERQEACLEFGLAVDAQDFDQDEIERTLALEETERDGSAVVTARFDLFGQPRVIEWTVVEEGGAWKAADIASPESGWRVSQMGCQ